MILCQALSKRGLHNLILCQPDFCLCKCVGQAQLFKKVFHIFMEDCIKNVTLTSNFRFENSARNNALD